MRNSKLIYCPTTASSRPKSPVHPRKMPHESCPLAAPCWPSKEDSRPCGQRSAFPQKSPGSHLCFSRTGVQHFPGSSTIELSSALAESGAYPPDRALPDSPQQCPLPLACHHLPKGSELELGRGAHLGNTILNQPYRRRVSTDRLNSEGSQFAAFLEGEPGPTLAGKTLSLKS